MAFMAQRKRQRFGRLWHAYAGVGVYGNSTNGYGVFGSSYAEPPVTFFTTTGTGIGVVGNSNGAGTGGYFTSTSGYALITGTGNVGIGTATPAYPLLLTSITA